MFNNVKMNSITILSNNKMPKYPCDYPNDNPNKWIWVHTKITIQTQGHGDLTYNHTFERIYCNGCIENQPNQEAHIGPNGCLGDTDNCL